MPFCLRTPNQLSHLNNPYVGAHCRFNAVRQSLSGLDGIGYCIYLVHLNPERDPGHVINNTGTLQNPILNMIESFRVRVKNRWIL